MNKELEIHLAEILKRHFPGISIARIETYAGLMHLNYGIECLNGRKIFYRGHPEDISAKSRKKGIFFGDSLSLEREAAIMELLRQTEIPVPDVYALEKGPMGKYMLLSCLDGVYLQQYLQEQNHNPEVFFSALRKIGRTLASTRTVTFGAFGSIQPEGVIEGAKSNFADRLADILNRHSSDSRVRPYFLKDEWDEMTEYISAKLEIIRKRLLKSKPQIVICDLHVRNFYVNAIGDNAGGLSGVFDVEFAQAAHPSLEWAFMNAGVFPLYGMSQFQKAKDSFLEGYREGGGDTIEDSCLEDIYLINQALSAVGIYDGILDGIRNAWSGALKQWSLDIVRGKYDPAFMVKLTRSLHKFPRL